MAKRWNEVMQSEGYQALNAAQQAEAQNQYFNEVVAPRVPEADREMAYSQFTEQYPLATQSTAEPRTSTITSLTSRLDQAKDGGVKSIKQAADEIRKRRTLSANDKSNQKQGLQAIGSEAPAKTEVQELSDNFAAEAVKQAFNKFFVNKETGTINELPSAQQRQVDLGTEVRGIDRSNIPYLSQDLSQPQPAPVVNAQMPERTTSSYLTQPVEVTGQYVSDEERRKQLARFDQIMQGMTFGFSDELGARLEAAGISINDALEGTDSGSWDELVAKATREHRQRIQEGSQQLGATEAVLYNILGSLPTGFGVAGLAAKGAQALNLGRKGTAALQVLGGGLEGATTGAGTSEGEVGSDEFLRDVGVGTVLGTAFGVVGESIGAVAENANRLFSGSGGRELIQAALRKAKPTDLTDEQYAASLAKQLNAVDAASVIAERPNIAALADLDELQNLSTELSKISKVGDEATTDINDRLILTEASVKEFLSPSLREGDTVGGFPVVESDLVANSGLRDAQGSIITQGNQLDIDAFTTSLGQQARRKTEELYDMAYSAPNTKAQQSAINKMRKKFSGVDKYWKKGREAARNSTEHTNSLTKALDEAIKAVSDDITAAFNAGKTGKASNLGATKQRLQELMDETAPRVPLTREIDPESFDVYQSVLDKGAALGLSAEDLGIAGKLKINPIKRAKELGKPNYQAANTIKDAFEGITSSDVRKLDTLQRKTLNTNSPEYSQLVQAGAGKAVRDVVERVGRDGKTGRLLTDKQVKDYNRVVSGNPVSKLNELIGADAVASRTAALANKTPRTLIEELKSGIPALAKDFGAMTALAAFVLQPNEITAGLVATRFGQAAVSRATKKRLANQAQKELFSLGATKADIENILTGQFNKIPKDRLLKISRGIADALGISTIEGLNQQQFTDNTPYEYVPLNSNQPVQQ